MEIDRLILAKLRVLMIYIVVGITGFFQLNSACAFSLQVETSFNVETCDCSLEIEDEFNKSCGVYYFFDLRSSYRWVLVPINIQFTWCRVNAATEGATVGAGLIPGFAIGAAGAMGGDAITQVGNVIAFNDQYDASRNLIAGATGGVLGGATGYFTVAPGVNPVTGAKLSNSATSAAQTSSGSLGTIKPRGGIEIGEAEIVTARSQVGNKNVWQSSKIVADDVAKSSTQLFKSGISQFKNTGLTNAGRAVTKHPQYFGFKSTEALMKVHNSPAALNKLGSQGLKNILRNRVRTIGAGGRYPNGWVTYTLKNGNAASWTSDGVFIGFRGIR